MPKVKRICIVVFLLIFTGAGVVNAAPSVMGATGLIQNPTADVLRTGQVAAGYYHLDEGRVGIVTANILPKLEVGVAGFRYDTTESKNAVNFKWSLASEAVLTPGLALGVEDVAGTSQRSFYAAASKTLPFGFRLHAGVGNGRFDGVFAGLEKTINPVSMFTGTSTFPTTTLIIEFDGKQMNYGARVAILPGFKVDAGWRSHSPYYGLSGSLAF